MINNQNIATDNVGFSAIEYTTIPLEPLDIDNIFSGAFAPADSIAEDSSASIEITADRPSSSLLSTEEEQILEQVISEAHNEIPSNSPTLLQDETTIRFSSAIWYEAIQSKTISLAGVGGIGSWTALLLARLRPLALFIYDPDTVDTTNISGQLYSSADIDKPKVQAMNNMAHNFANYYAIYALEERFTEHCTPSDIMICGFDNMEARAVFFRAWKTHVEAKPENERANCLFIDGRLAAEEFQVLCIKGDDTYNINRYETEFLFSDEEAEETICSYKQTSFMANMIASVMVNLFVNFVANQCNPIIDRDLPFFTTYNAETMFYKTEA